MAFRQKQDKKDDIMEFIPKNYALTRKEIEVDNAIFQIMDKGTREEKERLLKILENRTKNIKNRLK